MFNSNVNDYFAAKKNLFGENKLSKKMYLSSFTTWSLISGLNCGFLRKITDSEDYRFAMKTKINRFTFEKSSGDR